MHSGYGFYRLSFFENNRTFKFFRKYKINLKKFEKGEVMDNFKKEKNLPITKEDILKARGILQKYKNAKTPLEQRIIENDKWWRLKHWDVVGSKNSKDPKPTSAWLFNMLSNKHADAMDSFPSPSVLPREKSDEKSAKMLSEILPVILENNEFDETYSRSWWYKLKNGVSCYGVFWNPSLSQGIGDIDIKQIDILNLFWESGVRDINQSPNVFSVELCSNDYLISKYPFVKDKLSSMAIDDASKSYDFNVDTDDKSVVIDWYYKKTIANKEIVHYAKFVGDILLYSSENDPTLYKRGFYDHGKYPFIFDVLFPIENSPCGFGYIDIMKDAQMYIDKLNQIILKNALEAGRRRFFISDQAGINEEEFADWSKEFVHTTSYLDDRTIREINVSQLDSSIIHLLNQKIDELKETSGTRDVTQGGTIRGVTAASAISALQEAASKLSRDIIKSSYRTYKKVNYLIIELIRQFYDEPRYFRISPRGKVPEFIPFANSDIRENVEYASDGKTILKYKKPIFDIVVSAQKENPFSQSAQNELAKELYNMGLFAPERSKEALITLSMMSFEGKEKIVEFIKENAKEFADISPDIAQNHIDDENYLLKAMDNLKYGKTTLDEAKRRIGI